MAYNGHNWVNDGPPAINAQNLNEMDEEVERQALYGFEGTPLVLANNTDLDSIELENKFYMLTESNTYYNTPDNSRSGFLFVFRAAANTVQKFYSLDGTKNYFRRKRTSTTWPAWEKIYDKNEINTTITNGIKNLSRALKSVYLDFGYGYYNYPSNDSMNGVTYNWDDTKKEIYVKRNETGSAFSRCNVINKKPVTAGETYYIEFNHTNNVRLEVYGYTSNSSSRLIDGITDASKYLKLVIPSDIVAILVRLRVESTVNANEYVSVFMSKNYTYDDLAEIALKGSRKLLSSCDLNDLLKENYFYLLTNSQSYQHIPHGTTGFLMVLTSNNWTFQTFVNLDANKIFIRRANSQGVWNDWTEIGSGGGGGVVNNYTFNEYQNTYNVTATPSITTDTNSYLAPTGDTSDRTNDIVSMLTQTGVCRLGKGDYYVSNLVMPANTMIIGSGYDSRIILSGTADGYAVKMDSFCVVQDLRIVGNTSAITPTSTVGERHGILWQGNYTQDQTSSHQPSMGMVNNVYIENFTGGGITCYDTGYGTFNQIEVCNSYIRNCGAGINISYWSEFHKFTNVRTPGCYYGCINNGGNNVFVNCDFSSCKLAFLMDNSQDQSPNNSHGSVVGCVFNHTDSNAGIGIKILNCNHGYIFTGCQIFYSQIDIEDSSGIVISDTNFGLTNTNITIVNGGAVLFANNMHQGAPTISITNNQFVHFANCYTRAGAVVSA